MVDSLWGKEFEIDNSRQKNKAILSKINNKANNNKDVAKQLKSENLTIEERLAIIKDNVYKILGKYKNNTLIIKDKETLNSYLEKAIKNGIIAFDTETNNTMDYLNCTLVGTCIYTPGEKQAYIPNNHVDLKTDQRLEWQLNEQDIKEFVQSLIDNNVKILFHNYKFDYQVIKTTCNIEIPAYWDTMVGMKMIDEEQKAKLKVLYHTFIDPTQAKYDIEDLFEGKFVKYAQVDPDLFALYAATDAFLTYKLYEYEKTVLETDVYKGMYNIFKTIEMPIIKVTADMEYRGIGLNLDYVKKIQDKYHKKQEDINKQVQEELIKFKPKIDAWRLTPEAQVKDGKKTKNEQLEDPINLDSPKQLAILLFDVLKFPEGLGKTVDDKPRSTGANVLTILNKEYGFKLGELLVKKGKIDTLVRTFVDAIPTYINPKDNKIHTQFNPLGAIARFSSNNVNLQNIPSEVKDIRPMFRADPEYVEQVELKSSIKVDFNDSVETTEGYVKVIDLTKNSVLVTDEGEVNIRNINVLDRKIEIII